MASLTDDKAALIAMNHAMQKVTEQMGRLAVGAGTANTALNKDFTEQLAHMHWVSSAIFDTFPFDGAHRGRRHGGGGFAGGRYFDDFESDFLSGGRSPYGHGPGPAPFPRHGGPFSGLGRFFSSLGDVFRRRPPEPFQPAGLLGYKIPQDYRPGPRPPAGEPPPRFGGLLDNKIIPQPGRPEPAGLLGHRAGFLGYKAPHSQSLADQTTDSEFGPRRRPLPPEEPTPVPPFRGSGRKGLSIRRYEPYKKPPKSQERSLVPYEPPYEEPLPRPYYAPRLPAARLLGHDPEVLRRQAEAARRHGLIPYEPPPVTPPPPSPAAPRPEPLPRGTLPSGTILNNAIPPAPLSAQPSRAFFGMAHGGPPRFLQRLRDDFSTIWTSANSIQLKKLAEQFRDAIYRPFHFFKHVTSNTGEALRSLFATSPPSTQTPSRRSRAQAARSQLPESMRVRKYSGLGGPADIYAHAGSEFASGYFLNALLKRGTPEMLEGMGKLHAHLTGGREMHRSEFVDLIHQAREVTDHEGKRVFSDAFLAKLTRAASMARNKHELTSAHVAGLRMRGKLGHEDQQELRAQREHTKQTRDSTRSLVDFTDRLGELGHTMVKAGTMYGGVALQSASPDAFATLTGSFKLLAAQLGTELVPYAAMASDKLQKLARGFAELDPSTKHLYTNLFLVGTAAAGLIAVLPRVFQTFSILKEGLALAFSGVGSAFRFAGAHPKIAGYGAGAAAAIGLGAAVYAYSGHVVDKIQTSYDDIQAKVKKQSDLRTPDRIKQTDLFSDLERFYKSSGNKDIDENRKATRDRMFSEHMGSINKRMQKEGDAIRWITRSPLRTMFMKDEIIEHEKNIADLKRQVEEAQDVRRYLEEGPATYEKHKKQQSKEYGKIQDQAKMQAYGMLLDFQSRVQPAYYGIEDMGKKIQLEALGQSPLQEEIRRIQLDQLDALLKIAGNTAEQAAELKRSHGLP